MADPEQAERDSVRNYLQQQAAKRTVEELVQRVQESVNAVAQAARAVPAHLLGELGAGEGEMWTPVDCLRHVVEWNRMVAQQVLYVALSGELPDGGGPPPLPETIEDLLDVQTEAIDSLYAHVREAEPDAYLDVTWEHMWFGRLNWREWFLFLRVHNLDHAAQLQALAGTT
jgi:hypothetical protein